MRQKHVLLTVGVLLAVTSFANANIIETPTFAPDSDGVITVQTDGSMGWTGTNGDYSLTLPTKQQFVDGFGVTGHVQGQFKTDGSDPAVYIIENVENATSFAWTGYVFSVYMQKSFSFVTSTAPMGWTPSYSSVTAANLPNNLGPGYKGTVTFSMGTGAPVAIGGNADFGVKFSWLPQGSGYVGYCTEQTPTPEPATLAVLGFGALALLRKRSK
jgi:hypothetical protein